MKALIDTNVILDVLYARDPFISDSVYVLRLCEYKSIEGVVTSKTIADVYYFLRKQLKSEKKARSVIEKILSIFTVCDVTGQNIRDALMIDNGDFEDALQIACAKSARCTVIITRNERDYKAQGIRVLRPDEVEM